MLGGDWEPNLDEPCFADRRERGVVSGAYLRPVEATKTVSQFGGARVDSGSVHEFPRFYENYG